MSAIVSDIPGRLRVHIPRDRRDARSLEDVRSRLRGIDGVLEVQVRQKAGSVLIRYDASRASRDEIIAQFRAVGMDVESTSGANPHPHHEPARVTSRLADVMADANSRISRSTGDVADLRLLFPLALGALGVVKILREGFRLADVPAWVLLWYAFDAFWKLNVPGTPAAPEPPPQALDDLGT